MLTKKLLNNSRIIQRSITSFNILLSNKKLKVDGTDTDSEEKLNDSQKDSKLGHIATKYRPFKDEESKIVFDSYEETLNLDELQDKADDINYDPFEGINLERGKTGVYEIEELVEVLKRDNAKDIFVASVPASAKYVDYICIVTGNSVRHMQAIAQFVRKVYKKKRHSYDLIPIVEGENSKDWMAIDLGNIALHIFSTEARIKYDLETLWSVGPQYDSEYNKKDPVADMLEKHSIYLKDFQPAS